MSGMSNSPLCVSQKPTTLRSDSRERKRAACGPHSAMLPKRIVSEPSSERRCDVARGSSSQR
eukprot:9097355-Pyramimonas_sp.AAC.1